ncbi:DUF2330 domain-containing protein [Actinocrispum sp. NPDC049592]|uniref:DUF2330 domain-containing protein n=1 Tax=Actinocrispum sp. NPDC049592 TaxID=3154835 RepID=UPI0034406C9B
MRSILVVASVVLSLVGVSPLAAQACACGGFVGDQKVQVRQETAIVELAPGRETVTMQFAAETTATRAAWVMPVPGPADLSLGNAEAFTYLADFTKPSYEDVRGPSGGGGAKAAAAAPGAAVEVTQQVDIGPYSTAQLTGTDSTAVAQWLSTNGFSLPPTLATGLAPYLSEGWSLTAVRLTAGQGNLRGNLPPLKITFATSSPVYPMRLSGQATSPQALRLYVLADHRMDATSPVPGWTMDLYFAGRDTTRNTYVTRYDGTYPDPARITQDIKFTKAPTDNPHKTVLTRYVPNTGSEAPSMTWLFVAGIAVLIAILITGAITAYTHRRRLNKN